VEGNSGWRETLAGNLARLRREKGFTQAELGEKLNYSDKSVSKWERGEGVPDLQVLMRLADMYNVSLDEMTGRSASGSEKREEKIGKLQDRTFLMLITQCVIWLLAIFVFCLFVLVFREMPKKWLAFIYAVPIACLFPGVYFLVWRMYAWAFGAMSLTMWMFCVAFQLTFGVASAPVVYVIGLTVQLMAVLITGIVWWRMRRKKK